MLRTEPIHLQAGQNPNEFPHGATSIDLDFLMRLNFQTDSKRRHLRLGECYSVVAGPKYRRSSRFVHFSPQVSIRSPVLNQSADRARSSSDTELNLGKTKKQEPEPKVSGRRHRQP